MVVCFLFSHWMKELKRETESGFTAGNSQSAVLETDIFAVR